MKTFSFIGSDKNAGKTTMFNFIYRQIVKQKKTVCLSSIGINGEAIDTYEGRVKPEIRIFMDTFFITADEHLKNRTGQYETLCIFRGISKNYILGKCLSDFSIVLEGPNTSMELRELKALMIEMEIKIERKMEKRVVNKNAKIEKFLIDGSIDRQFLARPDISDGFYFALLLSKRNEQMQKAHDLLFSLSLPVCEGYERKNIEKNLREDTRSLLFCKKADKTEIVYHGTKIVSIDSELKQHCLKYKNENLYLYINGAFSRTLSTFLSPFKNMTVILDNFTQYLNVSARLNRENHEKKFLPKLHILNKVNAKKIFLKQEQNMTRPGMELTANHLAKICKNIPVHNLFRENPNAIGL